MEMMSFLDQLRAQLSSKDIEGVRALMKPMHAADIAALLDSLTPTEITTLFRFLYKDTAAEVFSYLDTDKQVQLVDIFEEEETVDLINRLYVDDAVDLLEELPANVVNRILLKTKDKEKREQLNRFLKYEEDTAGSVMSPEFIKVHPFMTVQEAIEKIRTDKSVLASYSQIYVTSKDLKLLGVLSIRELLKSEDDDRIVDIMQTPVISVKTDEDQEEALRMIQKYDFNALPVTDSEDRLVGIITVDDAMDISTAEASEDVALMAAVQPSDKNYFSTTVFEHVKSRLPWLILLMLCGLMNGRILASFQDAFTALPILVSFIPVLNDTGGNTGSQASTLVIRGLAMGEITVHDFMRVVWKEVRIALTISSILAGMLILCVTILPPHNTQVGLVVGLALILIVTLAKFLGATLPIFFQKIGVDPALMASPLITTIVDACGLMIYFELAKSMLHI